MEEWKPKEEKPLDISRCKKTDCPSGLHCFLAHKDRTTEPGTCWSCGIDLVDWERVHRRDIHDAANTIESLKNERVRHEFWCTVQVSQKALNYALRKGQRGIRIAAAKRIRSSVGKPADAFDGRRTKWEDKGDILHYAQHATATCCRKCIEVWHDIPADQALTEETVEYFAELLFLFVMTRLPNLGSEGIRVGPIRRSEDEEDDE
jgi:uncharacterized protein DUF4186